MKKNLTTIIKTGLLGFMVGALYAFISFYLITPMLHEYPTQIAGYGLQGFVLGLLYVLLKLLIMKISRKATKKILIVNLISGLTGGLVTGSYGVILTYCIPVTRLHGDVTAELKANIVLRIMQTIAGYALIGLVVGLIIGLIERQSIRSHA